MNIRIRIRRSSVSVCLPIDFLLIATLGLAVFVLFLRTSFRLRLLEAIVQWYGIDAHGYVSWGKTEFARHHAYRGVRPNLPGTMCMVDAALLFKQK